MKKSAYIILDKNITVGVVGFDKEKLKKEFQEIAEGKSMITLREDFNTSDELHTYQIRESLEGDNLISFRINLDDNEMSKLIRFSTKIPGYNEDHLFELLNGFEVDYLEDPKIIEW